MNDLTNPPGNAIGDRAGPECLQPAADAYLDHHHRNWATSEARSATCGSSRTRSRERAEHITRTLLGGRDVLVVEDALALPASALCACRRLS